MELVKLLDSPETTEWKDAEPSKKPPVSDEEALEHIRQSVNFDYPILAPQPTRPGSAIFVAGGPTLLELFPEIKRRKENGEYIFTCNDTHDWLVERGVIPNSCLLLDPKDEMADVVKLVQHDTAYFISTCASPKLWEAMRERGARIIKLMVAYGLSNDRDMKLMTEIYPQIPAKYYLPGGTMTPLRAMPLSSMLGFKKMELYGFDSCYSSKEPRVIYEGDHDYQFRDPKQIVYKDEKGKFFLDDKEGGFYYAYKKRRYENIKIVEHKGRRFLSSQVLIHQAMQIPKWYERLESQLEITIHGDSLSSWVLNEHKRELQERREKIGSRRWTDDYETQMIQMHERGNFGILGYTDIEWSSRSILSLLCTLQRPITILDYGAGAGTYADAVHKVFKMVKVISYDPFSPKFKNDPEPELCDAVNCSDVMEHVEFECIDNTLKYISDRCRFMACFSIGLNDALKSLPDGRNAHITQKSPKWWADKLRQYFAIVDYAISEGQVVFVCQHIDMSDRVKADGAYDRTELGGRLKFANKVGGK